MTQVFSAEKAIGLSLFQLIFVELTFLWRSGWRPSVRKCNWFRQKPHIYIGHLLGFFFWVCRTCPCNIMPSESSLTHTEDTGDDVAGSSAPSAPGPGLKCAEIAFLQSNLLGFAIGCRKYISASKPKLARIQKCHMHHGTIENQRNDLWNLRFRPSFDFDRASDALPWALNASNFPIFPPQNVKIFWQVLTPTVQSTCRTCATRSLGFGARSDHQVHSPRTGKKVGLRPPKAACWSLC